jgi:hypothetical protein
MLTICRRVEVHCPERRRGRVACELELERQCPGSQHWRQPRQFVEGEAERRMGVCQDD